MERIKFDIAKAIEEEAPKENGGEKPLNPREFRVIKRVKPYKPASVLEKIEKFKRKEHEEKKAA